MKMIKAIVVAATLVLTMSGCASKQEDQSWGNYIGTNVGAGIDGVTNGFNELFADKYDQQTQGAANQFAAMITRHKDEKGARLSPLVNQACLGVYSETGFSFEMFDKLLPEQQKNCLVISANYRKVAKNDKRLRKNSKHLDKMIVDNFDSAAEAIAKANDINIK